MKPLMKRHRNLLMQAKSIEERANKLKAIAECQENGYHWRVSEIEFTDDLLKVQHLRLLCTKTGVSFEFTPINDGYSMLMLDNDNMSLEEFLKGDAE